MCDITMIHTCMAEKYHACILEMLKYVDIVCREYYRTRSSLIC